MDSFNPRDHLMDLKGREYLQVMWRLVWFRMEKPDWAIDTHLEEKTDDGAIFSAKIYDPEGVLKASGYGSETMRDFRDYLEKAETKAIGRALAMLGYGTQFAPELDEGERIVDSPVPPKKAAPKPQAAPKPEPKAADALILCADCNKIIDARGNFSASEVAEKTRRSYGRCLCWDCAIKARAEKEKN